MSAIEKIPVGVLDHLAWAFRKLERARDEILMIRQFDTDQEAEGRYEWEYRTGPNFPNVKAAHKTLAQFEAMAIANGIDPQAVYEELGGVPEVPDWSPEARRWRRP